MFSPTEQQLNEFQTMPTELLAQASRGEIDLNQLAKYILTQRGQDNNGRWVGFKEAAKVHQVVI